MAARAAPIPEDAPVTTATRSVNVMVGLLGLGCSAGRLANVSTVADSNSEMTKGPSLVTQAWWRCSIAYALPARDVQLGVVEMREVPPPADDCADMVSLTGLSTDPPA